MRSFVSRSQDASSWRIHIDATPSEINHGDPATDFCTRSCIQRECKNKTEKKKQLRTKKERHTLNLLSLEPTDHTSSRPQVESMTAYKAIVKLKTHSRRTHAIMIPPSVCAHGLRPICCFVYARYCSRSIASLIDPRITHSLAPSEPLTHLSMPRRRCA